MGGALWKTLSFSLANERIAPGHCLSIHIDSGGVSVAYGVRFLSRLKIRGTRRYRIEEGKYPPPEVFASKVHLASNELQARQADVTLIVPKAWTIMRTADFPLVAKENLANVVGYELDRLTPLSPENAYYDYQVMGEEEGRLKIILAALKVETLAPYLHSLKHKGIMAKRVIVSLSALGAICQSIQEEETLAFLNIRPEGYEGGLMNRGQLIAPLAGSFPSDGEGGKSRLVAAGINPLLAPSKKGGKRPAVFVIDDKGQSSPQLAASIHAQVRYLGKNDFPLPHYGGDEMIPYAALGGVLEALRPGCKGLNLLDKGTHKTSRTPVAMTIILIVTLAALGIFSLAASPQMEEGKVAAIERNIAARSKEVKKIESLQKKVAALEKDIIAIRRFKTARPMAMDLFREFTLVLPANTWLARVNMTDANIELHGYASSATDILPRLEASRYFNKVEFASPTYRDVRMNADRFAIKMEIEDLPEEGKNGKKP